MKAAAFCHHANAGSFVRQSNDGLARLLLKRYWQRSGAILQPDEEDFHSAIRRAGIAIPPDRYDVMLAAYRDFQAAMKLLDFDYSYADEPATALHLTRAEAS